MKLVRDMCMRVVVQRNGAVAGGVEPTRESSEQSTDGVADGANGSLLMSDPPRLQALLCHGCIFSQMGMLKWLIS